MVSAVHFGHHDIHGDVSVSSVYGMRIASRPLSTDSTIISCSSRTLDKAKMLHVVVHDQYLLVVRILSDSYRSKQNTARIGQACHVAVQSNCSCRVSDPSKNMANSTLIANSSGRDVAVGILVPCDDGQAAKLLRPVLGRPPQSSNSADMGAHQAVYPLAPESLARRPFSLSER